MKSKEEILKTEYSTEFDELRKNRMLMSYFKYGPMSINYKEGLGNAMESLEVCLEAYRETGNTEKLVDAANYLMIEFLYPKHKNAHFKGTDNEKKSFVGMSIKEIENF